MNKIPVITSAEQSDQAAKKVNLLGMSKDELSAFFVSLGEKSFRATQVMKWIYQFGVTDFFEMTNISKKLQHKLHEVACVVPPTVKYKEFSQDGTRKWVFEVAGGSLVETVLIPADDGKQFGRKTLCISSQVGCALDCSFCSTGKQGFERDLTPSEIIGQLWVANQSYMENVPPTERENRVTNVVMMGMGEPLLNYDPVVASMSLMLDDHVFGLSKRRVTLSTSGVVPKMYDLAKDIDVALAISLHAPNDELRNELVPINKKYPLKDLIKAAKSYVYDENPRHKKHITIEYVMLAGVNDSDEHAHQLVDLLKDLPSKINLIPFNPFPHAPYGRSSNNRIHAFSHILNQAGFVCTIRQTRGDDIDAACGQLVGQVADRTRRAKKWQESIQKRQSHHE
ncbi:23S rRNA (adenine(2503)-C(2))-methyltransferase RlmN [Moraxella catarrhalis]|uniref:23S rRNA (adenine(2503)-C(2))-methyltransferase RlmN n=1 Tax=Moraxella catarrhalis TaxID=480 RepID=UPI0009C2CF8E|nr:23S rRNA (adenine(2503)-C(2))-methyltransferase RlmN [Moraxella catarrhalis]ARE65670.1 23S rRNA (adenine(2503)-C(2))-methyltransferase RlmN [Moraxella catarrhalis]MPX39630.1 23S rRNA (adenine(2503)-C(2))-methyltransferase RlmN [Moraxella catarrhalis]MPX44070.1 23S rRNA (adenine(2503)-C(2))-methyltransferase RlmN [Moraxella catarrhalis]MPX59683.1 23S rRNA (adenine(2503)-C(2))-methyltransferase RlmN [Moraxella catarrhalis]MPX80628.1 23S rRNA (adenine(2503)-C(2))-methyltransferase RlmN [Moraxe